MKLLTAFRNLWTVVCGLWSVDRGPWTVVRELWSADSGLWTVCSGLSTVDCGLWTGDYILINTHKFQALQKFHIRVV